MVTENIRKKYGRVPSLLLLLLCPVLALPNILTGVYHQKKSAIFFLSLFLGLFAYLSVPFADLYRHTMHYYEMSGLSWKDAEIVFYQEWFSDFINWFFVNHGINYEWWRLIEITESFYLLVTIFNWKMNNSPVSYTFEEYKRRFWLLFLFFELCHTISGVRFGFGMIQFVFGIHMIFERRKYIIGVLFLIFAMSIHMSYMFFVPLLISMSVATRNKYGVLALVVILFSTAAIILYEYSYLLGIRADWYFEGGTDISGSGYSTVSAIGMIVMWSPVLCLIPLLHFIFKNFNKQSIWCRLIIAWTILFLLFCTNSVMMYRLRWGAQAMIVFALLDSEMIGTYSEKMKKIILYCGLGITIINGLNYSRLYYANSRYEYLVTPVPVILNAKYDKQWIDSHIDNNTILKEREPLFSY